MDLLKCLCCCQRLKTCKMNYMYFEYSIFLFNNIILFCWSYTETVAGFRVFSKKFFYSHLFLCTSSWSWNLWNHIYTDRLVCNILFEFVCCVLISTWRKFCEVLVGMIPEIESLLFETSLILLHLYLIDALIVFLTYIVSILYRCTIAGCLCAVYNQSRWWSLQQKSSEGLWTWNITSGTCLSLLMWIMVCCRSHMSKLL